MWVKILLDAAGALLVGGAVLLWLWIWDIYQKGEPWYLMQNVISFAFLASILSFGMGIYLLWRRESKDDANDVRDSEIPSMGWSSNPGVEESRPLKEDSPKAGVKAAPDGEAKTGLKAGPATTTEPAGTASQGPGGSGRKQTAREEGAASPYIILGVHESDTLEMIQEVFARLEMAYHPDRYPDASVYSKTQKAAQLFKIKSAYEWIRAHHVNPSTRLGEQAEARGYYREACELVNAREYPAGVRTILKSIALDPNDAGSFNVLGTAHVHLSNYREAVDAFTRAIELGANNARIFNQRGFSYAQMGDDARAIEDYGRAIKLDPKLSDAFNNRGIVHKKLGDHRRAIEDFNSAIQLDPNFAEAHTLRGLAYGELGGNQSKVEDFKAAARLGSAFARQYLNEKGIEW